MRCPPKDRRSRTPLSIALLIVAGSALVATSSLAAAHPPDEFLHGSPPTEAPAPPRAATLIIYDVRDLLQSPRFAAESDIVAELQSTSDSPLRVQTLQGNLLITAPPAVHVRLGRALAELREVVLRQVFVDARMIAAGTESLNKLGVRLEEHHDETGRVWRSAVLTEEQRRNLLGVLEIPDSPIRLIAAPRVLTTMGRSATVTTLQNVRVAAPPLDDDGARRFVEIPTGLILQVVPNPTDTPGQLSLHIAPRIELLDEMPGTTIIETAHIDASILLKEGTDRLIVFPLERERLVGVTWQHDHVTDARQPVVVREPTAEAPRRHILMIIRATVLDNAAPAESNDAPPKQRP